MVGVEFLMAENDPDAEEFVNAGIIDQIVEDIIPQIRQRIEAEKEKILDRQRRLLQGN